ncbi:hypothetical protein ABPG72_015531 [Tetrahymena utriculariae]
MFQGLISSVLDKVAGEYVLGLNKENLNIGIFSGEVKIENVSLNPNIVSMLDLPINHQYSKIKKLELKVPFKNIGSKPVEVFLDGLYLVVTPKEQKDWTFKDLKAFKNKLSNIESFAAECVSKILAKQQEKNKVEKDAGYVQKLTMKIVENLQITIRNIHVRFEDTITKKYSWGFCLDKIEIYTTNKDGVKTFVDRTVEENKKEPMRKILVISNAGVYWNANETRLISDLAEEHKLRILNGMIQREGQTKTDEPVDFLFKISSQLSLTMNNKGNFEVPEIKVNLNLEHITLHLQQKQVQQVIEQIEFISKYTHELAIKKKNDKKIDAKEVERLSNNFTTHFTKMQKQEKDKSINCLTEDEKKEFSDAVEKLEIELLLEKTKKVVLEVQKELKIKELEKKKQDEQKPGFFGRFFGGAKTTQEAAVVTENDRAEIDKFINDNFSEEAIDAPTIIRPKDYVFFVLDYNLQGASIKLSNRGGMEVQCLQFNLNNIYGNVLLRDNNNEVKLKLKSMELQMIDEFLQNNSSKVINILSPTILNSKNPLIEFGMVSKPLDTPHIDSVIDLKMRSVRFDYNPYLVIRAVKFFDVKVKDDQLKQQAKDAIAEQIEQKQTSLQESMNNSSVLKLNVNLESPVIVLPFKTDGSLTNECWVLNLGNLSVNTVEDVLKPNLPFEIKALDMYSISLSKIKLSYYPSIQYYNHYISSLDDLTMSRQTSVETKNHYHTIEEFSIIIGITLVKGPAQGKINRPNIQVKGGIDKINLQLNPSIYKKLLKLGECFIIPAEDQKRDRQQTLDSVELEKNLLLKNASKTGIIYKRGNTIKTWEKYNGVLSGGYLYLFEKPKDLKPVEYIWVKNSYISYQDENLVGFKNAFNVKNKYADAYFACEKEKASQQWVEALEKVKTVVAKDIITDDELEDLIAQQERLENEGEKEGEVKKVDDKSKNFDLVQVEATFELGKIKLSMYDENKYTQKPFLTFQTNKLNVFFEQKNMKMSVNLGLGGMFLSDNLYQHKDGALNDFISSKASNDSNELINIKVIILDKGHPEYQNVELDIDLKFNTLIVNFKPETLAKVLLFIKADPVEQTTVPTSELLKQLENEAISSSPMSSGSTTDSDNLSQSSIGKSAISPESLQENESIILQAKIQIHEIKVVLINRRNHLPVNDISIQNIGLIFQQKSDEMFLKGSLGNLQVNDLTNFPNTIYLEDDWQKIKPQELIGLLEKDGASSLLEVEFRSLSDGSNKIKSDNVATFLKVNFSSIHISYIQRPILRLLDYSLVQLLGPLGTPQFFVDEGEIAEDQKIQLAKEQEKAKDPMEPLKKMGKRQVISNLNNPKGMSMDVVIQNPLITLKPNPSSKDYLEIDLGTIKVTNQREKNGDRLLECKKKEDIKETYSENFNISMNDMQMRLIRGQNVTEMTKAFNFNVNINMVGFFNEYKYIYGNDIKIDTTMIMKNYISPIIFRMSNADYNLVMMCLFHNISYDDGCDRFLIHDWARNQEAQVVIEKKKKEEAERKKRENISEEGYDKEKGGIYFQLDMESFSIFTLDKERNMPFARVTLGNMRVIQIINELGMSTNLYAKTLNGSCFRFDGAQYIEGSLLGDLNIFKRYTKEQAQDLTYLVNNSIYKNEQHALEALRKSEQFVELAGTIYEFTKYDDTKTAKENKFFQIVFELQMKPNGDKDMDIVVGDFKVQAETGPLLALAGFAAMDASVQPPKPVYEVKLTKEEIEAQEKNAKEIEQYAKQVGGGMKINISVKNVIICTPCADSTNILAIRGIFDIKINFSQAQSINYVKNEIKNGTIKLEQSHTINQTGVIAIELQGLEIFICDVEELKRKTFKKVNKRSILLPLNMSLSKTDYLYLASEQAELFSNKTLIQTKLEKTSFKISFSDLNLINQTVQILLEDMKQKPAEGQEQQIEQQKEQPAIAASQNKKSENVQISEEEKIKKELEDQENKVQALTKNEAQINIFDVDADLKGFQIYIINDLNAAYVPVLDFNIFEMNVKLRQNNLQLSVATVIQFSAEYYNPRVGLWEPIIEKVGFNIDYIQSEFNNIRQLIAVELNSNYSAFNVTFSTQFLSIVTKCTKTVKKEILQDTKKERSYSTDSLEEQKQSGSQDEIFQHVSPYTVRNETGYPIEVETDLSSMLAAVQRNSIKMADQKIYKCQLKNFEEKNFEIDLQESEMINDPNSKETFVFKKTSEQVKAKVLVPGQKLKFIEQIDLDKVRNRLRPCKNESGKKLFEVITEVKLDMISSKKVLNISSPYYFINQCNKQVSINLYDQNKKLKQDITLNKGQRIPIPIDFLTGSFNLTFFDDKLVSDRLSFKKLCNNFLNQAEEMKLGDTFLMLKVHKDTENNQRTMFSIEPPYKIKNCLPKTLLIQFINHKKFTAITQVIPCGEVFEFYNCSQRRDSFMKIQIPGHFWSNEAKVSSGEIEKIIIKDVNGNQSEISCHHRGLQHQVVEGCRQFYIYCKGYLINETPYKLNVFTQKDKKKEECKLVGGQRQIYPDEALNTNIILLGQNTGDLMSLSDAKFNQVSKQTSIGGIGNTQIDIQTINEQGHTVFQTMGINVSLKNVDYEQKLFSKVITISPRFIIVNKTGYPLELKQNNVDYIIAIDKDSRIPLYWYDDNKQRFLNMRLIEEEKDWRWSGNLNVLELGTVNFMIRNQENKMDISFLRTDVRSDDSNIYIVVEKATDKERPYLIQNYSKNFKIELKDLNIILPPNEKQDKTVDEHHQYYFSWENPFEKEKIVVSALRPLDGNFQNLDFNFSPDQIYFQDKIQILPIGQKDKKKNKDNSLYLKWLIDIDGFTKIIKFEDSSADEPVTQKEKASLRKKIEKEKEKERKRKEKEKKKAEKEQKKAEKDKKNKEINIEKNEEENESEEQIIIQQQISIFIKDFGLSVVQNHRMNEKPTEFLYLTIKGLEFISIGKEESKTYQIRIKLLNIDQNSSYDIVNPVIFTPQKYGLYKENSSNFFLNIMIEQNLIAKNITLYNNVAIELDPFTVRIEEQFISTLLDFLKGVEEARYDADAQSVNSLKEYLDEVSQIEKGQNTKFKWQICEIPPTSIPTFINQLILSNIEIALTFKAKVKTNDSDLNVLKSVFTALGVALADIEASLKLNGIKLVNCFETTSGIVSKLTAHYKDQAISEVLKALGSLNIIGNPVGLFQNISTGVTDLFTKPAEGFVKGPLEGGLGIMQGASSLIKNTMAGAFNSVNKITGSLSSGISALCMDEEYLRERDRMRSKRPKHLVDGAVQGVTSIFSGVANGITGVFLKPFEGAKKGGALGFLKGIGKGVAGLIVKPVSGVLDAASSVADGIKNTITYGDDKANEQRLRYPRVFYGREGFYKEFIDLDAGMKVAMQLVSKGKYQNSDFLQTFLIQVDENNKKNNNILVITYDVIMLFDELKKKKKWYFPISDFDKIEQKQNGIHFTTTKKIKSENTTQVFIQVPTIEQQEYIYDQINTLKYLLDEEKKIEQLDQ